MKLSVPGRSLILSTFSLSLLLTGRLFAAEPVEGTSEDGATGATETESVDGTPEQATKAAVETDDEETDLSDEPEAQQGQGANGEHAFRSAATPEQQAKARALFTEGNALVRDSFFVQGIAKYEEALTQWDHPGIHYNLALALLNLDQPLRLRQHLIESLKFGADALGKDKARRAEQYLVLVEKQLTELVVISKHQGAEVRLDGKLLFTAPGEYRAFVLPGQHSVQATAPGYQKTLRTVSLVPGEETELQLRLYTEEDWLQYERRWDPLGPIVVTISGAVVLGTGAVFYGLGLNEVKQYEAETDEKCAGLSGCTDDDLKHSEKMGSVFQGIGIAGMAVGAATLATGGMLLYLNRKIAHRVDPESKDQLSFAPVLSPGLFGVVGRGTF